jgi:peptide/nickel transport system substrate-binding protein
MVKDVRVLDPLTVVVDLTQPWAAFPSSYLDGGGSYMMAPAMIHSSDGGATHPIGTGPFIFESWTPGGSFKVKKNTDYWQKGLPHLDSIEFRVITDESTAVAALQSGDVNMILTTSAQDADRLANSYTVVKNWDSESVSALTNTVSSINGKFNPLSNIHARLALAYATDRSQIASEIGAGVLTTTGPFAPSGPWDVPDSQSGYVNYDPAKAKQELTTYEQETGQSSLNFTLAGVSDVNTVKLLQELQAQWKRVGISAQLQTMDQPSLIKQLVGAEFQSVLLNSYNYPDPDTSRVFWTSETVKGVGQININFNMYKSAQMDADLNAGRVEGYLNQRKVAYTDLEHQINAAVLNIWLYHTPYTLIADHNVRGLNDARDIAFGNFMPKTWLGNLWLTNA